MPTDMTIVTSITNTSRQDGVFSSPALRTVPAAAKADDISPSEKNQDVEERQKLAAAEQDLPPGERVEDAESLQKAVSDISAYVQNLQRDLQFRIDTDLGQTVVSVVDSETKEVIRQIPSEDVLERARFLEEKSAAEAGSDGLLLEVKI
jgi:flagellar protein FlaG